MATTMRGDLLKSLQELEDRTRTLFGDFKFDACGGQQQEEGGGGELAPAELSLMKKMLRTKLAETEKQSVEVERHNPDSPLYFVKSFAELNLRPELLRGVYAMGFTSPSKIQEMALPALLANPPQNLIAQSQNGTGKTAAFLLAALSRVDPSLAYPQVLVLSPTYELALQTGSVAKSMARYCPAITFRYALRGEAATDGMVREHVVIGTPGKVLDWAARSKILDLSRLAVFVLDEADVMIDIAGHHDQSIRIHKRVPSSSSCQMLLFSATYTERVMRFAELMVPRPVVFRLRREDETLRNVQQFYVECPTQDGKLAALGNIYGSLTVGQAVVFCRTRRTALWLVEQLATVGLSAGLLSGELTVQQRVAVMEGFRRGAERVLVATNVCARGIDVAQVTLVVNFDLPILRDGSADCEAYLHRIGRTGRFGKGGVAVNMVDGPVSRAILAAIQTHFGHPIRRLDADDCDLLEHLSSETHQ